MRVKNVGLDSTVIFGQSAIAKLINVKSLLGLTLFSSLVLLLLLLPLLVVSLAAAAKFSVAYTLRQKATLYPEIPFILIFQECEFCKN